MAFTKKIRISIRVLSVIQVLVGILCLALGMTRILKEYTDRFWTFWTINGVGSCLIFFTGIIGFFSSQDDRSQINNFMISIYMAGCILSISGCAVHIGFLGNDALRLSNHFYYCDLFAAIYPDTINDHYGIDCTLHRVILYLLLACQSLQCVLLTVSFACCCSAICSGKTRVMDTQNVLKPVAMTTPVFPQTYPQNQVYRPPSYSNRKVGSKRSTIAPAGGVTNKFKITS